MPVRRISRGSRGTCLSGVFRSSLRISLGGFERGGRGYRGSRIVSLFVLESVAELSDSSLLLSSDFGGVSGVGGNRNEVSDSWVPGFWASAPVHGGVSEAVALGIIRKAILSQTMCEDLKYWVS